MPNTDYQPYYRNSAALVIGINDYMHVGKLERARADAESVAKCLTNDLGFPKNRVIALLDDNATRAQYHGKLSRVRFAWSG